jgi:hypothetical protein
MIPRMRLGEAIQQLIDERGIDHPSMKSGLIVDEIRRLTGEPDPNLNSIATALWRARKKARENGGIGGMRVR